MTVFVRRLVHALAVVAVVSAMIAGSVGVLLLPVPGNFAAAFMVLIVGGCAAYAMVPE